MAQLGLIGVLLALFTLLWADARRTPSVSGAVWLTVVWMILLSARPIAQWVDPSAGGMGSDPSQGSLLDSSVLSVLIAWSAIILFNRRLDWSQWIRHNPWLVALLLFAALSVLWSDFSGVAAKRWIRGLGTVLVVLLVLSERDPAAALAAVVRRSAILLIPLSVMLIKYFRFGTVDYNQWTGEEYLMGAMTDKNALGRFCMIAALFALWDHRARAGLAPEARGWLMTVPGFAVFSTNLWLLWASKSSTSLACFILGVLVMLALRLPVARRQPRAMVMTFVSIALCLGLMVLLLDVHAYFVALLGRDLTLTGRVFIWHDLLLMQANPLVGVGYDSFWLGERLDWMLAVHKVTSTHNGFLDIYLNLGIIGLTLLMGMVLSGFASALRMFAWNFEHATVRMVMIMIFLIYNITEAATVLTALMFFIFLLVAVRAPVPKELEVFADTDDGSQRRPILPNT